MDTRRLQHFVAVVDHGGFTAAAKATFVSQPALSLAVKELEADLGTLLFDRIGRRVQLTAAGTALLGPARQVLRDLETGRAAVTAVSGLESGVLSLACLPTLAADPTATLVGRFRSHHPGVRVDLAAPEDITGAVRTGRDRDLRAGAYRRAGCPRRTRVRPRLGSQVLVFILPPGTTSGVTAVAGADRLRGHAVRSIPRRDLDSSSPRRAAGLGGPASEAGGRLGAARRHPSSCSGRCRCCAGA